MGGSARGGCARVGMSRGLGGFARGSLGRGGEMRTGLRKWWKAGHGIKVHRRGTGNERAL